METARPIVVFIISLTIVGVWLGLSEYHNRMQKALDDDYAQVLAHCPSDRGVVVLANGYQCVAKLNN